jgi:hypothetical protein
LSFVFDTLLLVVTIRDTQSGTELVAGATQRQTEVCRTFA